LRHTVFIKYEIQKIEESKIARGKLMNNELIKYFQDVLQQRVNKDAVIINVETVRGGCINRNAVLTCNHNKYFIKYNTGKEEMFLLEAEGLSLLNKGCLRIPQVLSAGHFKQTCFLLMEYIEPGTPAENYYGEAGEGLACIHRYHSAKCGLDKNNFIGTLIQNNEVMEKIDNFFITRRILPMAIQAEKKKLIFPDVMLMIEKLSKKIAELIPNEKPSLLHGDLWSGNTICDLQGNPCLVDPAVYYGCREADIAMTKLFGGFEETFYSAYNNIYPMEKKWQSRIDLWNIYPLLVHVNLFGASYVPQLKSCLRKYTD
jgi:protein-ribulosamine 3-kinase